MSSLHLSWAGRREDARGGGGQEEEEEEEEDEVLKERRSPRERGRMGTSHEEEEEEEASRRIINLFVWDATTKAKDATATHLRHRARPLFAISTTCEYSGSQSYSAIFHSRTPSSSYIVSIFDIARAAGRGAGTNCGDVTRGEIRGGTKRHDTRAKPRNSRSPGPKHLKTSLSPRAPPPPPPRRG